MSMNYFRHLGLSPLPPIPTFSSLILGRLLKTGGFGLVAYETVYYELLTYLKLKVNARVKEGRLQ